MKSNSQTTHATVIVVPCYNASSRLNSEAFLSYVESDPQLFFLFVDDGGTDNTYEILKEMEASSG